jgi:hypothetical protein
MHDGQNVLTSEPRTARALARARGCLHRRLPPFCDNKASDERMPKPSTPRRPYIPHGSWPRQMTAALAAGYCGEPTVEAFLSRVGMDSPEPTAGRGRSGLWLKEAIDEALERRHRRASRNAAVPDAADLLIPRG